MCSHSRRLSRTHNINTFSVILSCLDPSDKSLPLGLENNAIPDSSLTASSEWNADHGPKRGRLNLARVGNLRGAWAARTNDANQWIQVKLDILTYENCWA